MQKRKIIIGGYDTAAHGWTLTAWKLSAAVQKTAYVEKPNGDGSWDLSTALSDGIPRYQTRELKVTLECSEGARMEREEVIREMVNQLDGLPWSIRLPDDEHHYITGRVHVAREYNDLAHGAVTVTAVCDPWKYANEETVVSLTATTTEKVAQIINDGRRAVVPTLKVEGTDASVTIGYKDSSLALSEGTHQWPVLLLTSGNHPITYSGTGKLTITYREAVLE